jgi:hypothetical protein
MDRARLQQILAGSAVRPQLDEVVLPDLGETVWLRRPTREQALRAVTAAGRDEDMTARAMVGALRFALVDIDGKALLDSFEETAALFNQLSDGDSGVLLGKLSELLAPLEGAGEVGKAS